MRHHMDLWSYVISVCFISRGVGDEGGGESVDVSRSVKELRAWGQACFLLTYPEVVTSRI